MDMGNIRYIYKRSGTGNLTTETAHKFCEKCDPDHNRQLEPTMSRSLPSTIRPGILHLAGATPESHKLVKTLLEEDRIKHHCFYGGLHNHLSHQ
jgi:hypothetical protein